ncbi:MAG: hypothetical protein R3C56_25435 [Pirellulaceae bacterium]
MGLYSDDPEKNPHAVLYRDLDYDTVISQNLRVMDGTAITQCREHQMPILVFNFKRMVTLSRRFRVVESVHALDRNRHCPKLDKRRFDSPRT